jgi:Leucine-rich repeat (LRR) protein
MSRSNRTLRISLKGILVGTAMLAVWIGWNAELARRQSRVVKWVRSHNGVVEYDLYYDVAVNDRNRLSLNDRVRKGKCDFQWARELLSEDLLCNATSISIQNAGLTNILPIAEIRSAECVCFASNSLIQIEPLRGVDITNLVILSNNKIDSIAALSGMTKLRMLDLRDNQIKDLSPLKSLNGLLSLDLSDNSIVDVSPLEHLTNLKMLSLRKNRISDVRPLLNLKTLQVLDIRGTGLDDRQIQLLETGLPTTRLIVE